MNVFDLYAKIGLDTSGFTAGLSGVKGTLSSIGGGIKSGFSTIAKVGAAAFGVAEAAVGGFVASSISAGKDFDSSMSQVSATMGLTMDEMADQVGTAETAFGSFEGTLRDFAQFMGKNTAFSATQAADALNYMALAGYDVQESMDMLPNVLNLAASGGIDLARASDMITDAQTAFGISAERTTKMVDEMAKAASTGNTSVEQMGDAFLVVGGLARELNGGMVDLKNGAKMTVDGVEELEIALTAMANAGIKGSEAGTHMRNMLLKLSSPTSDGTTALENMGVTIFDTEGKMRSLSDIFGDLNSALSEMSQERKLQTISDLFNTRDMASAEALLGAVEGEVVKIGDEVYSMSTAYEKFGDAIYDSSQGFEIVRSSWDEIGEAILNASYSLDEVNGAVQKSGVEWEKYADKAWNKNGDGVESLTRQIIYNLDQQGLSAQETAEFIASEYDMSFSDAVKAVNAAKEAMDEATGSAQQMADTQLDNLQGDITKFKSALEGAQIEISDALVPTLRQFVELGTDGVSKIANGFKENGLTGAMDAFGEALADAIAKVIELAPDIINAGMQLMSAFAKGITDNAPQIMSAVVDIGGMILSTLKDSLWNVANNIQDTDFAELGKKIADGISNVFDLQNSDFGSLLFAGARIIENLASGIAEAIPELVPAINNIIENIAMFLLEEGPSLISAGVEVIAAIVQGISQSLPVLVPAIVDVVLMIVDSLINNIDVVVDAAISIIVGLTEGIINALPVLIDRIPEIIVSIVNALIENAPKLFDAAVQIVTMLATGIIENFGPLVSAAWDAATSFASNLVDGIKTQLEKSEIGRSFLSMVESLKNALAVAWDFLTHWWAILWEGAKAAFTLMKTTLEPFLITAKHSIEVTFDAIKTVVTTAWELLKNAFRTGFDVIKNLLDAFVKIFKGDWKGALDSIVKAVSSWWDGLKRAFGIVFDSIKGLFERQVERAKTWGRDLLDGFINGIKEKIQALKDMVSNVAGIVKDFLGFSEPEEGPLSNSHTYAPDMMKLFAQGIRDNEKLVTDQIAKSFDFSDIIADQTVNVNGNEDPKTVSYTTGETSIVMNIYGAVGQDVNELAEIISEKINAATTRRQVAMGAA